MSSPVGPAGRRPPPLPPEPEVRPLPESEIRRLPEPEIRRPEPEFLDLIDELLREGKSGIDVSELTDDPGAPLV